jgi:serine/threonine protein kinase
LTDRRAFKPTGRCWADFNKRKLIHCDKVSAFFEAHDPSGCRVCLRRIDVSKPAIERAARIEASTLKALRHPAIAQVSHDFEHIDSNLDVYYLVTVTEAPEGCPLRTAIGAEVSERFLVRLMIDIAKALEYLHSTMPMAAHRALSPDNVRVDAEGNAVLVSVAAT